MLYPIANTVISLFLLISTTRVFKKKTKINKLVQSGSFQKPREMEIKKDVTSINPPGIRFSKACPSFDETKMADFMYTNA